MPARRITYADVVYLSNPECGVLVKIENTPTNIDLNAVQGIPSGGAVSAETFARLADQAAAVRQQLIQALLETPIPPISGSESLNVQQALAYARRMDKQYRADNGLTPV